jgi:predicted transposase/invertase (TIGR01784 family)
MELKREKYINPFTDFGFKRLFGEEMNKDLLLDFLNVLLHDQQGNLVELSFMRTEKFGRSEQERKAIFDIYCENEKGEKFLVEMQKSKQAYFKDRSVYYSSFPIQEQAQRSDWNYRLNAVYTIGILDFVFDEDKEDKEKFRYDVQLTYNQTKKIFYDKLTFVYLEMPKFTKTIDQLETHFDKWLYILKNLHKLDRLPERLKEKVFEKVFAVAEISKLSKQEYQNYEDSLKIYRDLQNSIETARSEGEAKGEARGVGIGVEIGEAKKDHEFTLRLYKKGYSTEQIVDLTGLPVEKIEAIIKSQELQT